MDRQNINNQQANHQSSNRTNQCNPNHLPTGQGHPAAYPGSQDKANLNNHANQKNPNNQNYAQQK
ncbi:GATA zinc finger domain-containing protein 14-like [Myzus persicae]|uniref:GATA zinc finger domain-containing protein 14-like n=1 Tax=Myzus persicae TaxID=13164 RepID=UPI000B930F9F|nr:GATA zinc finger domain-containing protein 14-like [Myzus persicae]